jgi:uncharacterized tellurite resistance protein B-like protein
VKEIKALNELIDSVAHVCSNRDENFVLIALKQEKTRIFKDSQEIAKSLLFPAVEIVEVDGNVEIKEIKEIKEIEENKVDVKKSKKVVK